MTYQTETKGTSLFKRHGNWEFVALSGERGAGCAHVPVPTQKRKGKEEGRGGEDEATDVAEAFSLTALTLSSGGPQSVRLIINLMPLVEGTPTAWLHTHLQYHDRSGHEELPEVEGRMHSLESASPP